MDLNLFHVLALVLLVSAQALRFDRGPQQFTDSASQNLSNEQKYETKEVVLYLTPSQVNALENEGAVLRPKEKEVDRKEYIVNIPTLKEQEPLQTIKQIESAPVTENVDEREESQISQLQEIFSILNRQIEDEFKNPKDNNFSSRPVEEQQEGVDSEIQQESEQAIRQDGRQEAEESQEEEVEQEEQDENEDEEQDTEEQEEVDDEEDSDIEEDESDEEETGEEEDDEDTATERPQKLNTKLLPRNKQRDIKYVAKSIAVKEKHTGGQSNTKTKKSNTNLLEKISKKAEKKKNKSSEGATTAEKKQKIPSTKNLKSELPAQDENRVQTTEVEQAQDKLTALLTPLLSNDKIVETITQQRGKLLQSELELQRILRQLKEAPKYNDQKYAIELENLRENIEKQNALARAEVIARTKPVVIKEDLKRFVSNDERPALSASYNLKEPQPYTIPLRYLRPVSVSVAKSDKESQEAKIPAAVESEKRRSANVGKNVYYKLKKPYIVERKVSSAKNKATTETPERKPDTLTIIRHLWEH